MIADIEKWRIELLGKVHFEKDKVLLNEAIACLINKAYRAGYIVAWLSMVESLRNKIKELSITGNAQALKSLEIIEKEESLLKSNDMKIIDESYTCGFITKMEKEELIFFWGQRCKFAHPYSIAPHESELIFIIEKSINLALSKQIVFKKEYIDDLITKVCETIHFIKDDYIYIGNHAKEKLARIDKTLHPYFFKTLFFKFSEAFEKESSPIIVKRIASYLTQILIENGKQINTSEWGLEDRIIKYPNKFCLLLQIGTWEIFDTRIKDLCIEYIKSEGEEDGLKTLSRRRFKYLVKKGKLENPYYTDFYNFLYDAPFTVASELYQKGDEDLEIKLDELISSAGYSDNGLFFDFLYTHEGNEFLDGLNNKTFDDLVKKIILSGARNCYAAIAFIKNNHANERLANSFIENAFFLEYHNLEFFKFVLDSFMFCIENLFDNKRMEELFTKIGDKISNFDFQPDLPKYNLLRIKKDLELSLSTPIEKVYVKKAYEIMLEKVLFCIKTTSDSNVGLNSHQ